MLEYVHYGTYFMIKGSKLEQQGVQVKVSDLSDALNLPRPGVTRTVKEMEAKGYLKKTASAEDGRVAYLSITEAGAQLSQTYDKQFFDALVPCLQETASCWLGVDRRV